MSLGPREHRSVIKTRLPGSRIKGKPWLSDSLIPVTLNCRGSSATRASTLQPERRVHPPGRREQSAWHPRSYQRSADGRRSLPRRAQTAAARRFRGRAGAGARSGARPERGPAGRGRGGGGGAGSVRAHLTLHRPGTPTRESRPSGQPARPGAPSPRPQAPSPACA